LQHKLELAIGGLCRFSISHDKLTEENRTLVEENRALLAEIELLTTTTAARRE
jgi:hypothetical protein